MLRLRTVTKTSRTAGSLGDFDARMTEMIKSLTTETSTAVKAITTPFDNAIESLTDAFPATAQRVCSHSEEDQENILKWIHRDESSFSKVYDMDDKDVDQFGNIS